MVLVTLRAPAAWGGSCPPAVALTGDEAAVHAVREQLDARGIADATPSCPVLRAHLERRGAQLVVRIERPAEASEATAVDARAAVDASAARAGSGARSAERSSAAGDATERRAVSGARPAPGADAAIARTVATYEAIERTVGEPATAATVIESWVRSDVSAPLLETRAVAMPEEPAAVSPAASGTVPAVTGIQLFVAAETSMGSDRTLWQGMQLGACVMLGPICAAARVHAGKVIVAPGGWDHFVRKGAEAYGGIDIPIAVGRTRLTPGCAAGYGTMLTHHMGDGDVKTGLEFSGPLAEVHVSWSIPLTAHLALDLATTAELTQATGMETHGIPSGTTPSIDYPDEPRALFRLAVGVRYGAL